MIKNQIYRRPHYFDFFTFSLDEKDLILCSKPAKFTILHRIIESSILFDISHTLKKVGQEVYEDIYADLEAYSITYIKHDEYQGEDFHEYLCGLYERELCPFLEKNVFFLLFEDREVMKKFNLGIAEKVSELKYSTWPHYLKRDGVLKRNTYWPKWLKEGVYRRDNGHCAICKKDLSGLLSNGPNLSIDHIVPLNLGGTNDPTNLQILCSDCNTDKGGDSTHTSDLYSPLW